MTAAFLSTLDEFGNTSPLDILGRLTAVDATRGFASRYTQQTNAWLIELEILAQMASECIRTNSSACDWTLLLEFDIPRRGKRPDAVLIANDLIFILEFKIGATSFSASDQWQAFSYGLDLRDFHGASGNRVIIPILIITGSTAFPRANRADLPKKGGAPEVLSTQLCADAVGEVSASLICDLYDNLHDERATAIQAIEWNSAEYRPTPTIIEAAQRIFAGHGVANISHAFASNLDATCESVIAVIRNAQRLHRRAICFVTGIPGAGKTLAGLNVVHDPFFQTCDNRAAVFLSGNGPLVKIVRAALVRDRQRSGLNAADAKRLVNTFIDNVHRFINTYGIKDVTAAPYENVIVFDEAQRAWDRNAVEKQHGIQKSEPELVLDAMERAADWCVIIALVGGGQEIHQGEAGLSEWGRALNTRDSEWEVSVSPIVLCGDESVAGNLLFDGKTQSRHPVREVQALHLDVSVRSPRARRIADWVNALLNSQSASLNTEASIGTEFPIVVTRDLNAARRWLRNRSEGQQRVGLLASSGALRLRAHGIEVSSGFRRGFAYDEWFLADQADTRSSNFLEVAATEFECQGLELDWTCVCWGEDFIYSPTLSSWVPRKFRGTKWQIIRRDAELHYARNKYRVLLTRARRGMAIWIPDGCESDGTRDPDLMNATWSHFLHMGLPIIDE